MNSKRKADLQRKLSMVSVTKPPAGLADRIKNDIPEYLGTQRERDRFTKSIAFNLRVAASVILLVASTVFCLHLFNRAASEETRSAQPIAALARVEKKSEVMSNATPPPLRQPVIAPNVPPAAPRPVASVVPPPSIAEHIVLHRALDEAMPAPAPPLPVEQTTSNVALATGGVIVAQPRRAEVQEAITITAEAPIMTTPVMRASAPIPGTTPAAPATAPTSPLAQPAAAGAPASSMQVADAKTMMKSRTEIVPSAQAADLNFAARNSVFGISVSDNAFEQVKSAIERGEHPANVDVEALVNYFAGAAKRAPRDVSLEVEGSPAPINEGPRTVFVRYTVDTARDNTPANASFVPPIATNAHVEIEFDPRAVASYRRVGGEPKTDAFEPSLLKNVSVTALYAIELKANLTDRLPVATITLHYNSVTSGRVKMQTRTLRAGDVAHPWTRASRRHRLASLGAVWGEKLLSSMSGADVARRAEELSKQEPKDERAKELATLANASSR